MIAGRSISSAGCLSGLRTIGTVGLSLSISIGTPLASAQADFWGDTESNPLEGTGPHPDGGDHTYCFQPLESSAIDNINRAEKRLDDDTHAAVWLEATCDYSGGTETDVVWDTVDLSGPRTWK